MLGARGSWRSREFDTQHPTRPQYRELASRGTCHLDAAQERARRAHLLQDRQQASVQRAENVRQTRMRRRGDEHVRILSTASNEPTPTRLTMDLSEVALHTCTCESEFGSDTCTFPHATSECGPTFCLLEPTSTPHPPIECWHTSTIVAYERVRRSQTASQLIGIAEFLEAHPSLHLYGWDDGAVVTGDAMD